MILYKYIRLSDEDGDLRPGEKLESNSIVNQRALLNEYIDGHEELSACTCFEICDDGYSGLNFDRPGIKKLLLQARSDKVDIIMVKDFSRFGRSNLDTGKYLEKIFPLLGIRFISVNDGYDSKYEKYGTAGNIDVGMKGIINEMYSRDLSVRVKTSRRQYAERGECVAAYAIYGYMKSPENRRTLVPDPEAAETVRRIYTLYLDGHTTREICEQFNAEGVLTPMLYKRAAGVKRKNWGYGREENKWSLQQIASILRDERYTGKLLSHKRERYRPGNPDTKASPPDKWIVVDDAFPPVISRDIFDAAQALHPTRMPGKQMDRTRDSNFAGLLKCGCCGYGLSRSRNMRRHYYCQNKGQRPKGMHTSCDEVRIFEDELTAAFAASVRHQALLAAQTIRDAPAEKTASLRDIQGEVEKRMNRKVDAFQRYNDGKISRRAYDELCLTANAEIAGINKERERIEHGENVLATQRVPSLLQSLESPEGVNRELMKALIERITVYPDKRIEIKWRFSDPYQEPPKNLAGRGTL